MSLSVHQMIQDAKKLVNRLKERDSAADALISQSHSVSKLLDAMKQYSEDVDQLNITARYSSQVHAFFVNSQQQDPRHLRVQKENKELRVALEEHQTALELIMSKYREQMAALMESKYENYSDLLKSQHLEDIQNLTIKIDEMASVMAYAARADEEELMKSNELISQLTTENNGLRELLDLPKKYNHAVNVNTEP